MCGRQGGGYMFRSSLTTEGNYGENFKRSVKREAETAGKGCFLAPRLPAQLPSSHSLSRKQQVGRATHTWGEMLHVSSDKAKLPTLPKWCHHWGSSNLALEPVWGGQFSTKPTNRRSARHCHCLSAGLISVVSCHVMGMRSVLVGCNLFNATSGEG